MSDAERGQVSTAAAEVYDAVFVPALFGRFAGPVAQQAGLGPADRVVDVACGSGALTRAVRGRTSGRVVGVDVNPAMLTVARRHGGAVEYLAADGQHLPFGDGEFDVSTCQFGLMFYPDPAGGMAELARVARRGTVAVWDRIERSAGYTALRELFRDELGAAAAGALEAPFVLGAPGVLDALVGAAGVGAVSCRSIAGTARFASIDEWVTTEVRGWTLGASVGPDRLAGLLDVARDRLGRFQTHDGCVFGVTARLATWSSG